NNPVQLSPVGTFAANNFGLVDIAGNVAEWVEDCWHDSHENRPAGARAWVSGAEETRCARVIKGGSWMGQSDNLRPGARVRADEEVFGLNIGFRVARDLSWDDAGAR
ncbi:MAG: SUMF1/EgtB/PvdO family nonheme iron enzyme, partial [Pseudomonadota bacterium]